MAHRVSWLTVWEETLVQGAVVGQSRGFFTLPLVNLCGTFRVLIVAFTGGGVQVFLHFGNSTTEAFISNEGINFVGPLVALNASSLASMQFERAPAAPGAIGAPPGILPPIVAVNVNTNAGTNLSYRVSAACLGA